MTNTEALQLEKLLIQLNNHRSKYSSFGPIQIGAFVIQPIYWSEDEEGDIIFDTDSMIQEFEPFVENLLNENKFLLSENSVESE